MSRAFHPVPTHEPEVIAAGARAYRGDDEKVATTSLEAIEFDGVKVSSRYDKAHELTQMMRMLNSVSPELRRLIVSIWCDSKAQACYSVELRPCDTALAEIIAEQLENGTGGHNGIWIEGHGRDRVDRNPYWPGEEGF